MGSCPVSEGDDRDLFFAEVSDAAALADRGRVRAAKAAPRPRVAEAEQRWIIETQGHKITARAPSVNRATLRELCAGKRTPQARLDLHRMPADAARKKLAELLAASCDAGHHCVLIVSGRGNHSPSEPVLRTAVVEWITGPLSRFALALCTALPRDGGDGAFYVLLRKRP